MELLVELETQHASARIWKLGSQVDPCCLEKPISSSAAGQLATSCRAWRARQGRFMSDERRISCMDSGIFRDEK